MTRPPIKSNPLEYTRQVGHKRFAKLIHSEDSREVSLVKTIGDIKKQVTVAENDSPNSKYSIKYTSNRRSTAETLETIFFWTDGMHKITSHSPGNFKADNTLYDRIARQEFWHQVSTARRTHYRSCIEELLKEFAPVQEENHPANYLQLLAHQYGLTGSAEDNGFSVCANGNQLRAYRENTTGTCFIIEYSGNCEGVNADIAMNISDAFDSGLSVCAIQWPYNSNQQKIADAFEDIVVSASPPYVYLQRMMDLCMENPRERWHIIEGKTRRTIVPPRDTSSTNDTAQRETEEKAITTLQQIFSAAEMKTFEQAYQKTGREWPSVPRMNLGATRMESMLDTSSRMLEYISPALGEQSREYLTNAITRACMGEFQQNPHTAMRIISSLRGVK